MAQSDAIIDKINAYIVPLLFVISGFLIKNRFDAFDKKLDDLVDMRVEQAVLKQQYSSMDYRITSLEQRTLAQKAIVDPAKHEEIYTIESHKKKN